MSDDIRRCCRCNQPIPDLTTAYHTDEGAVCAPCLTPADDDCPFCGGPHQEEPCNA